MKPLILPAGLALAAVAPGAANAKLPGGGHAKPNRPTAAHAKSNRPTPAHARAYEHVYEQVAHELGRRAPGRNIVKNGVAPHRPATDAETVASTTVLKRMLAPAPTTSSSPQSTNSSPLSASSTVWSATATATATTTATAAPSSATAAGGLPPCASESGTNYSTGASNTNGSSGATGRYQITPSTAANYGCNLSTSSGQDACAQTIYRNQGAGAWVGCGG